MSKATLTVTVGGEESSKNQMRLGVTFLKGIPYMNVKRDLATLMAENAGGEKVSRSVLNENVAALFDTLDKALQLLINHICSGYDVVGFEDGGSCVGTHTFYLLLEPSSK